MVNYSEVFGKHPRTGEPSLEASKFHQIPIEEVNLKPESRIVIHTEPRSPGADRYRILRLSLRFLKASGKLKTLLITSALPQDGKSTHALNIATFMGHREMSTLLLMEADLYHPSM